jgi:uncharacterized protein DUF4159
MGRVLLLALVSAVSLWSPGDASTDASSSAHQFTFARIRYGAGSGFRGFGGSAWSHDYPRGDEHLSKILDYLTLIDTNLGPTKVFDFDAPDLHNFPIAYVSEPGFWTMSDAEKEGLRAYVYKGGFLIFDDFEAEQWHNFEAQMRRAFPELRAIEIDVSHPIFHSFFELKKLDVPHPLVRVKPVYYGYFRNNDPRDRMIAIVNYNNDLAEYWEFSDTGLFAVDWTNDAYKLAVNYIVYAMTH